MSAERLFEVGFENLVSVIPPDAEIAPSSKINPKSRGKCPGIPTPQGWVGYKFTTEIIEPAEIDRSGANVGLLGNYFPGLDIDSEWPELTAVVLKAAAHLIGPTVVRLSREPRRHLIYRTSEPFAKSALLVTQDDGQTHTIEWLGKGQQYLVQGRHPSGVNYGWAHDSEQGHLAGDLQDMIPEELPEISREGAVEFLNMLKTAFEAKGLECELVGDGRTKEERAAVVQEDLLAPDLDTLRAVVEQIPNTNEFFPGRDDYIRMGHAIRAAAGDESAVYIFNGWAQRWDDPAGNDPETVLKDWLRMQPPFRVGWSWLQEQAENMGSYSSAEDEFEADAGLAHAAPEEVEEVVEAPPLVPQYSDDDIEGWIMRRAGKFIKYVPLSKDWHVWQGFAWELDETNRIFALVKKQLRLLADGLTRHAEEASKAEAKVMRTQARTLCSVSKRKSIVEGLTHNSTLTVRPTAFDADKFVLNTPEGVCFLTDDGVTRGASDPDFMLAKATAVAPASGTPWRWFEFLHEATGGDEDLQCYLQKLVGYMLTGDTSEQALYFIWGRSNTGKSVFINTIKNMLGTYAKVAPADTFSSSKSTRIPDDVASLVGSRLVISTETQAGKAWDERRIKTLTGGDPESARHLFGRWFEFDPSFKILIAGNHEPTITNLDDAMRRRLHVVPLDVVVPEDKRDRSLPQKLKKEWPQILKWALEGYILWRQEGLDPPMAVVKRSEEYFSEEDLLGQWIEEECDVSPAYEMSRFALFQSWQQWCNRNGYEPGTLNTFARKLKGVPSPFSFPDRQVGPNTKRLKGNRGIRVKPGVEEGIHGDL